MPEAVKEYLKAISDAYAAGNATEHTHRPAFKTFLERLLAGITAVNEPKREACGAPDYVVKHKELTVGYVEAKNIGVSLDETEKSEQLERYRRALGNLILTDYLEVRWFVDGDKRASARFASVEKGKIRLDVEDAERAVRLLQDFLHHDPAPITSPEVLARHMARITDMVRDIIVEAFERNRPSNNLLDLRNFFSRTLLPGLELESKTREFADMYAQTIAYGLFAARCNHDDGKGPFHRIGAAREIPKTNPLLRTLFESVTGTTLEDEPFEGFVDDLVQLLATADISAILKDFGTSTRQNDPVVHFYETFLAEYDRTLKEVRGVYYTPAPVVSYIVRSVDKILKQSFDLPSGLADTSKAISLKNERGEVLETVPKVLILDPACGTGTFLYAVVEHIRRSLREHNQGGMWPGYVRDKLLPRLFGFELLMASYAVAHFKLGLQLAGKDLPPEEQARWAYDFQGDERLNVFLTNSLEQADKRTIQALGGQYRFITQESLDAHRVKQDMPIMVILGNPPYSGHSANASKKTVGTKTELTFIGKLIDAYKHVDGKSLEEKQVKWLHDDYVKFIRWAQWRIEKTGSGVVGFVTSHSYLDNPTFRGMRQSLMNTFSEIHILDLHGNSKKKEATPDGKTDKNVFDIQQGVAVVLLIKKAGSQGPCRVFHADVWGDRAGKYDWLETHDVSSTCWKKLAPRAPSYWFVPWNDDIEDEYCVAWDMQDVFPVNSVGIVTARDSLCIGWTDREIFDRVCDFASLSESEARKKYDLGKDARDWKVNLAQTDLKNTKLDHENVTRILYRPFDMRMTYYTGITKGFICMPMARVMKHMAGNDNVGLITVRRVPPGAGCCYFSIADSIVSSGCIRSDNQSIDYVFPLYLRQEDLSIGDKRMFSWSADSFGRIPNLGSAFIDEMEKYLSLSFQSSGHGDLQATFGPDDVCNYIYAIFHCPAYRSRYAQFLKADFPRVPLTSDAGIFRSLCGLGKELATLHLLKATERSSVTYPERGSDVVEKGFPVYVATNEQVQINANQHFANVTKDVWAFQVGGYQVAEKWLKDRRGRKLEYADVETYQKIIHALSETIRIMKEIDAAIPSWPIQ